MAATKQAKLRDQIRRQIVHTYAGKGKSTPGLMQIALQNLQNHLQSGDPDLESKARKDAFSLLKYAIPNENSQSFKSLQSPVGTNSVPTGLSFNIYLSERDSRAQQLNPDLEVKAGNVNQDQAKQAPKQIVSCETLTESNDSKLTADS